jgi:hypothetical protein
MKTSEDAEANVAIVFGIMLSGAVVQAERRISLLVASRGRSLARLEKMRGVGMTPDLLGSQTLAHDRLVVGVPLGPLFRQQSQPLNIPG